MEIALEEYWLDLRDNVGEGEAITSLPTLHRWVQDLRNPKRPSFVVVSGGHRERVYRRLQNEEWMFDEPGAVNDLCGEATNAWVHEGLIKHLTHRIRDLRVPADYRGTLTGPAPEAWELLWGLISCSFLVVQEPLDGLVDKRFSLLSDAHRAIMEARFEALESKEDSAMETAIRSIGKWIEGNRHSTFTDEEKTFLQKAQVNQAVTEPERFETILFLLTLARQNGVVGGVVLALDGLEQVSDKGQAEELFKLLEMTERWTKLGSPLGILLGWRGSKEDQQRLKKLHPRLAKRVAEANSWLQQESL